MQSHLSAGRISLSMLTCGLNRPSPDGAGSCYSASFIRNKFGGEACGRHGAELGTFYCMNILIAADPWCQPAFQQGIYDLGRRAT